MDTLSSPQPASHQAPISGDPQHCVGTSVENTAAGRQIDAVLRMARLVETGGQDLKHVEDVLELMSATLGATFVTLYELDNEKRILLPMVTSSRDYRDELLSAVLTLDNGLAAEVINSRQSRLSEDVLNEDPLRKIKGLNCAKAAQVAAPLYSSGAIVGVIIITALGNNSLRSEDLGLLTIFAGQAASLVTEVHLQRDLERTQAGLRDQFFRAEKMRAMGEMASGVFHDFNNILGAIVGRIQLIQYKSEDDELKKALAQMERIALQGAETVKRLQEFSRMREDPESGVCDLSQVASDALELTRHRWETQAQKRGVSYTVERLLDTRAEVSGSHSQLVDAVANLIFNAVDAMPNGGKLTFETSLSQGRCLLSVGDSGAGMSRQEVEKVFTPFYTTKGTAGTGLGLAVVHDIVTNHGGEITVESERGKGSVFRIDLPACTAEASDTAGAGADAACGDDEHLRLLVVDDDSIILDVVSEALQDAGHTVDSFAHGGDAIDAIGQNDYNVVVTDLGMPDVTGWDVARAAKMHQPQLPVVVISGWGAQFGEEQLTDSGVDAMLAKPFHLQLLRETIERLARGENIDTATVHT